MSYNLYLKAEYDINEGLIRKGLSLTREGKGPRNPKAKMAEMGDFLAQLGHPERGIPAVHVGGTSGKGSVAAGIAGILTEAGFKVGLHISPYLQSATEKIWITDRFVSAAEFAELVEWVMPLARNRLRDDTPASIHGMASVAIALEAFKRAKVDLMVFEVGCGGRYDLTAFVETQVAVITNVGWDHVISLGPSLEDIAWHKAGIARSHVPLITGASGIALEPIRAEAKVVGAELEEIPPGPSALDNNCALAERASRKMARKFGIELSDRTVTQGLRRVKLAGRSEIIPGSGPRIVLDGAHNADKLRVAVECGMKNSTSGPRIGVVGFLGTKAKPELTAPFVHNFDQIIATEPAVYAKTPHAALETARLFQRAGLRATPQPDAFRAVEMAIERAGPSGNVLITGSFYLVGQVRDRWYAKRDVVQSRTSWPVRPK